MFAKEQENHHEEMRCEWIGTKYIITVTDYLTRWAKETPIKDCSATIATQFIFENILTRFGYPRILMSDQDTHFLNKTIQLLTKEFHIYH